MLSINRSKEGSMVWGMGRDTGMWILVPHLALSSCEPQASLTDPVLNDVCTVELNEATGPSVPEDP